MMKSKLAASFALAAAFILGGGASYVTDHGNAPLHTVNDKAGLIDTLDGWGRLPRIGDKTPDGTAFAGISPDKHKPLYTTVADASGGPHMFDAANGYCTASREGGHTDWRVPTSGELNVLFRNRAAIGGFDESAPPKSHKHIWYWSSSQEHGLIWGQRFSTGEQAYFSVDDDAPFAWKVEESLYSALRCVRG